MFDNCNSNWILFTLPPKKKKEKKKEAAFCLTSEESLGYEAYKLVIKPWMSAAKSLE